jgi:uncharacterized protein GlcG (DUF336 family)
MNNCQLNVASPFIDRFLKQLHTLIPLYLTNPLDAFSNGNVAVCIIDAEGNVYGKIWGKDKITGRNFFKNAWVKSSQVWITGIKTGDYERRLFNDEFDEAHFGIGKPDLIGWEGGIPIILKDNTVLSIGFSGFRGHNDINIIEKAVALADV